MAVPFNKTHDLSEQIIRGTHDWDDDTFKIALTNTAPAATQVSYNSTDHPDPAASNGYSTGGAALTITVSESSGTTSVRAAELVFTASGGSIGPFRYAVLYNDTATNPSNAMVGWLDYGSSISLADGEPLTIRFSSTNPGTIFTLA